MRTYIYIHLCILIKSELPGFICQLAERYAYTHSYMYTHTSTHPHTKYTHTHHIHTHIRSVLTYTLTHARTHIHNRVMPRYLHVMRSPPQLALWSSIERRRFRPCNALEQERRQRPKGRLAALQPLPTPCKERTEGH